MIQVSGVCNYPYSNGEHVVDCHWPQTSAPLRRQSPEGLRALCWCGLEWGALDVANGYWDSGDIPWDNQSNRILGL